ncbi:coiled-coil domain-containing protein 97 [Chironomus tepperi]|uniref:coiled-coil domain-containing protein 97 n=1 Tax=Chironomus tepperi TaxID=113505 RepID=UPI00391F2675
MDNENAAEAAINLDDLRDALINHISTDNKAFFKHQQKDEDDLQIDEKKVILTDILANSHSNFLARFGMMLKKEHLKYFESQDYDEKQEELVKEQIKKLYYNLDHERTLIKNRRYVAMIKLINEKEYFSDIEMERRNPVLYNELVGKFISPAERAKRRRPNAETSTLVDVLLNQIDYDETCENAKKQRELEGENSRQSFDSESDVESSHMQWGNFDNEDVDCSRKSKSRRKRNADILITAGERDLLRDEFLGIMYNDFLTGRDTEFFDYSQVDKNEEYDDMSLEKDQDFEDKYFDEDSQNVSQENGDKITKPEESEDELDIYMQHIEEHLKRQNNDKFQEEFEDE